MNKSSLRLSHRALLAFGLLAVVMLTGCAQIKLGTPVASIENIQKAKASGMQPSSVGDFVLAKGKPATLDTRISVHSNSVSSPYDQSFAKYLKETLSTDLQAAGLLNPASSTVIKGELTDSQIDPAIGTGSGKVAARFTVTKAERQVFDKEFVAESKWESSFVGGVAIPRAINEYTALYRALVSKLLDDPAFRAAVK